MIRSLNSAASGLKNFQQEMEVIGHNIANVNTTGFKASRVEFAEALQQNIKQAAPGSGGQGGQPAVQVGSGVTTAAVRTIQSPGALTRTGSNTDLAIAGEGFFVVRDVASDNQFVTRAGDFHKDESGYLVTNNGKRVQGYSDSALTTVGDIQLDATGAPAGSVVLEFTFGSDGKIYGKLANGDSFVRGQVLLQKFEDPQALVNVGNNLFSGIQSAGPLGGATPAAAAPESNGLGRIESMTLELSNVDLASEFTSLISAQRAFQATARMITTSDEVIQELVNLKR